jgi:alpha-galactosidase
MPSGHLEHLYYGRKINLSGGYEAIIEKTKFLGGNQIAYSKEYPTLGLEDVCLEMSSYGKGDIREPFLEITHADCATTCDFLFKEARMFTQKEPLKTLPSAYIEEHDIVKHEIVKHEIVKHEIVKHEIVKPEIDKHGIVKPEIDKLSNKKNNISLEIELFDKKYNIALLLMYSVFYESNVITRSAKVINNSNQNIKLDRIMSGQLDLDTSDYIVSTFHGAWAREMNRYDSPVHQGIIINDSKAGTSSNRSNPFFMLSGLETNEDYGDCYGFNLIYSGNHYAAVEVNSRGKLRVINGIQPSGFQFLLQPKDSFEAPEAVLTYSDKGYTGMSHNMHHFIRNHIVRGEWKKKVRPILINSWEANYFKFKEGKL